MRLSAALLVLIAVALSLGCARPQLHQQESYVFGTRVEVTVAGLDAPRAREAAAAVLREFDRLHRMLHAWQPSEVTALNEAIHAGRPIEVSEELAGLLRDAQRIAGDGDGLFDPGIGRLIRLWGFQADEFTPRLPPEQAIADWLAQRPSVLDLEIHGRRVTSRKREVAVDLGGYAKGYALDRAAQLLRETGVRDALINIGGNVLALGSKNGAAWRVGIRDPRGAGHLASLALADGEAIGTSGDYQRFFEIDGVRYAHLLDPRSGRPAVATRAVTVLIPAGPRAGTHSDALSKPLYIAGDDWPALARKLGVSQVLRVDARGRIQVTAALRARLEFSGENTGVEVLP